MSDTAELNGNLRTFETLPEMRTYVHKHGCGGETDVGDWAFPALCNPLHRAPGTICAACNKGRPFDEFEWADTHENLAAYRKRLYDLLPPAYLSRSRQRKLVPLLAFLVPVAIGGALHATWSPSPAIGLGVGAIAAITTFLMLPKVPPIAFHKYV